MAEKQEERGFKVVDRRLFDADGKPREEAAGSDKGRAGLPPESGQSPPSPGSLGAGPTGSETQTAYHVGESADAFGPIDFPQFILSIAQLAFMFLGDLPNPQHGRRERNVVAAKQQIDLIELLQEKTRGNLTAEEERLVSTLLYELRMRFVEVVREQEKVGAQTGRN